MKQTISKLLVFLIALSISATTALAQSSFVARRNDNAATIQILTNGQLGSLAADQYGKLFTVVTGPSGLTGAIFPVSNSVGLNGPLDSINGYFNVGTDTIEAASTTTVLNLTAHVARIGDLIIPTAGTAANVNVSIPICAVATNTVTLCYPLPTAPSTDAIQIRRPMPTYTPLGGEAWTAVSQPSTGLVVRNDAFTTSVNANGTYTVMSVDNKGRLGIAGTQFEDAAAVSGDPGVFGLIVANETAGNLAADGDYLGQAGHITGASFVNIWNPAIPSGARGASIVKAEDVAHVSGDVGVLGLGVNNRGLSTTFNSTLNDYTPVGVTDAGIVLSSEVYDSTLSSAQQAIKLEDVAAASGDALVAIATIRNTSLTTPAADGDYQGLASGTYGEGVNTLINDPAYTTSSPIKLEDSVIADGTALMMAGAVTNEGLGSFAGATDLDANPIAVTRKGIVLGALVLDSNLSPSAAAVGAEDIAIANNAAGVKILAQANDVVAQSVGTTGDGAIPTMDLGNRLITTLAPAGETWKACSSAVTNTSDASIKAGVASNFLYVTSINCHNNSAVASIATFKSNTTAIWSTYLGTNALSNNVWTEAFSIPLRLASGEALQFAMTTTATSTICCAAGYQSTI